MAETPVLPAARILVVDDRAPNLVAVEALLKPLGHEVVCTASGEEALGELLSGEFAVVLLDVRMPGMDGFEVAAHIKGRERTRHLPIIFMTALTDNIESALRAYSHGAVDFLIKPFDPDILRSKVSVFVELFRRGQQLQEQTALLEKSNAELQEMARAAQAASEAKTSFLNMVGHELRTPLTVIAGYAAMLREGALGEVPPAMQRPLDVLEAKSRELSVLVESLLAAAQMERGTLEGTAQRLDVVTAVAEAVHRLQPRATLTGTEVVTDLPEASMHVEIDHRHLHRVLDNLLNNAVTYGGASPWVRMSVASAENRAVIRVEDHGMGIPPEAAERIFEQFARGDEAGKGPPGSGLGLWLCRKMLEPWGATISLASSVVGEGSCFEVTLPLVAADASAATQHANAQGAGRSEAIA